MPDAGAELRSVGVVERPVEADARRPLHVAGDHVGGVAEAGNRHRVRVGLVGILRRVHADAVGQRDARPQIPLVARVEAPLIHLEGRRLHRIARRREAAIVLLREALIEEIDAVEPVGPEGVADEQVAHLEELVVRAEGDDVPPLDQGECVVDLDDVLIELVAPREALGAGDHGRRPREDDGDCRKRLLLERAGRDGRGRACR